MTILRARFKTRGDCADLARPCVVLHCRHHLWAEVTEHGSIRRTWPTLAPWQIPETCSLDVGDRGEHSLEQVAAIMGATKESVRQWERMALLKMRAQLEDVPPAKRCRLCGARSVGWLAACRTHVLAFAQGAAAGLVVREEVGLATAWEAFVERLAHSDPAG